MTMATMQPLIDFELLASPFCFLSHEREFNIWLKFRLHYQEPITVFTTGSIFDPAAIFCKGRIEIGEKVHFATQSSAGKDTTSAEPTLILRPESRSYFFWSTSPGEKWHKYPFNISGLGPNRKYTVKYCNHGFTKWLPGPHPEQQEPRSHIQEQPYPIAIKLLSENAPSFTTRQALPPTPPVTP